MLEFVDIILFMIGILLNIIGDSIEIIVNIIFDVIILSAVQKYADRKCIIYVILVFILESLDITDYLFGGVEAISWIGLFPFWFILFVSINTKMNEKIRKEREKQRKLREKEKKAREKKRQKEFSKCKSCGSLNRNDTKYCENCGIENS